jgi:hypothetical protein
MGDYPEHEKLEKVKERSQACGEFLEWLDAEGIILATWDRRPESDRMHTHMESSHRLLARHFGVDLDALEKEKRAMLDQICATPAEHPEQ